MATKKKDLEIIYNVQWKNKPGNGGDKSNIIGMYDIPATTLNWETFKSYLLKNSGLAGEDVKVFYITDSNREFAIESQTDFQIALYAFRRKARMGDLVNIRLESVSEQPAQKGATRYSNDVETQSDNNEAASISSTCCNSENPPEWFLIYMTQFKKDMMEDVSATVSSIVSNMKPTIPIQPPCYHTRKSKVESSKRIRKPMLAESSHDAKDLLKSLKLEGKLERKLEKIENKYKKVRDKKLALLTKSTDSDVGQSSSRSSTQPQEKINEVSEMDATPLNTNAPLPHFLGGEIYLHKWEVLNSGTLPWTSKTSLRFTWGSKALKPLDTNLSVPYLKPGDSGAITVRLQIPNQPGDYECYWHFHHRDVRFGHWLGCRIIVDPFDLKGNHSVLARAVTETIDDSFLGRTPESLKQDNKLSTVSAETGPVTVKHYGGETSAATISPSGAYHVIVKGGIELETEEAIISEKQGLCSRFDNLKLQDPTDTNCSSDSDNHSTISFAESDGSRDADEFVVVHDFVTREVCATAMSAVDAQHEPPRPEEQDEGIVMDSVQPQQPEDQMNYDNNNNTGETDQNISGNQIKDETASNCSQESDIIIVTFENEQDQHDKYAYIIVDGQKLPIPKKMIKSEYLETAEKSQKQSSINLSRASSSNSSVEVINKSELPSPVAAAILDHQTPSPVLVSTPEPTFFSKADLPAPVNSIASSSEVNDQPSKSTVAENVDNSPKIVYTNVFPEQTIFTNAELLSEDNSHCSTMGSCFSDSNPLFTSSRMFIFPEEYAGFEVYNPSEPELVQKPVGVAGREPLNLTTSHQNPFTVSGHVPNYQQTPREPRGSSLFHDASAPFPIHPTTVPNTISAPGAVFSYTQHPNLPMRTSICQPPGGLQIHHSVPMSPFVRVPTFPSAPQLQPSSAVPTAQSEPSSTAPTAPLEKSRENVVHILPETLVSGAVNVASSAINTARSVINMMRPQETVQATTATNMPNQPTNTTFQQAGRWVNGHWVTTNPDSSREANLLALAEMGFWDRDLNATLLARYKDDLSKVVAELVQ